MQLSHKQKEFIVNATHRYNLKVGAVRSGKSFGDMAYVIPSRIRERAGKQGLNFIIGVSTQTVERNVLQPMREIYTDKLVGNINSNTNIAQIFGEPVYCIGAEKQSQVAKLQGSSIKYCYGDEVAKWSQSVFDMLKSRLDKEYSCMDGSLNPESPNHWLKAFIDRVDIDMYLQHYTIFDNPFLPADFVEKLCTEYEGTVYYARYIKGEWAQAEGLIYPMWENAIAEPPENVKPSEYMLSLDYGTMNAFACLLWAKYGQTWYAIKEYYYSGRTTGEQKTDEEYGADLDAFVGDLHDIRTIIDPSASSFIALLRKKNGKYRVVKADNNVSDGIRNTASCLKKGTIKISPTLRNWKSEIQGYVWDEKAGEDTPVKIDDHLMDAMRYFVRTNRLGRILEGYQSMFG